MISEKTKNMTAKITGTVIIIAAGVFLLDPVSFVALVPEKSRPETAVSAPEIKPEVADTPAGEYSIVSENGFVRHKAEYFDGTCAAAVKHAEKEMTRQGFSKLEVPGNRRPVMLFSKAEEIAGVIISGKGKRFRIVYAGLGEKKQSAEKLPPELADIALGRRLLTIQSPGKPPMLITGSSATLRETERRLHRKLTQNGWEIPRQMPETPEKFRLIQARKALWQCDIAIAPGEAEFAGMNTIVYRFSTNKI